VQTKFISTYVMVRTAAGDSHIKICGFQVSSKAMLYGEAYKNESNFVWYIEPDSNGELKIVYFSEFTDSKSTVESLARVEANK
jgi:hypothetical protein